MSIATAPKINRLLADAVPGGLLFAAWLRKGYSAQLIKRYRNSGWLEGLSRGVMYRKNDSLSALAAVYCYTLQTGKKARIAAHSYLCSV